MKESKYNYHIPLNENQIIVFNGISLRFFVISKVNHKELIRVLSDISEYEISDKHSSLLKTMYDNGFIIPNEKDEFQFIKMKYEFHNNSSHYLLSILPTYKCNFSCWYCVQHHKNEFISPEIISRIKKHIKTYIQENSISVLELAWFGGEPLLSAESIIDISLYAKEFCKSNHIKFINGITTNGSLLTNELIRDFAEIELNDYQITIDGNREFHNKIRFNKNIKDSFHLICNNIRTILDCIPKCNITLRYNYTANNISNTIIHDLNNEFPLEYRKKIVFFPRQVWQEDEEKISELKLQELVHNAENSGYIVNTNNDVLHPYCYGEKKHYNTIFQNGTVDKCANISLNETRGELSNDGHIIWFKSQPEYQNTIFSTNNICLKCKYLPLCMGPCPVKRKLFLESGEPYKCIITNKRLYFSNIITGFCKTILKKELYDQA